MPSQLSSQHSKVSWDIQFYQPEKLACTKPYKYTFSTGRPPAFLNGFATSHKFHSRLPKAHWSYSLNLHESHIAFEGGFCWWVIAFHYWHNVWIQNKNALWNFCCPDNASWHWHRPPKPHNFTGMNPVVLTNFLPYSIIHSKLAHHEISIPSLACLFSYWASMEHCIFFCPQKGS